ncbi:Lead, cadmium, zinc and mercury transporting ATPase; Copper-translocating P-type ATPase [hydrothermal vent metagenome]|uniref:Lead, cadmium, zinc and mercury transporting ATPase Copper-translocating P-type ATPase n=1 Tax=hydrothermal vent metagenome TaxID=652676 RepID=A0A3B1CFB1_9ZZZZ
MNRISFKIRGMDCAEEVVALKREVGPITGGEENLSFDLLNGKMSVSFESETIDEEMIRKAVSGTGMEAVFWEEREKKASGAFWKRRGKLLMTGASGLSLFAGFVVHWLLHGDFMHALTAGAGVESHVFPMASIILYTCSIVAGAWFIAPKALYAARAFRPDINLLMIIAVTGAVAIGEWLEAATVTFLFSVSLALETWSISRARHAVETLMDLSPLTALLLKEDGSEEKVSPEKVLVGSIILVKPGEKIPLDGEVIHGASHVNQAPITGESVPVDKTPGDIVFAGTINGDGALKIKNTKPAQDTTLAHIIRLTQEAFSKRSRSEQWVEKFARVYTPVVMGLALGFMLVPPLAFGGIWEDWFYRALVLLVIACPCALVISTPVSVVAALTSSARNGVLIKGGTYMEAPARLEAVALDKTGTLSEGKPSVVDIVPFSDHDEKELLERAAAIEAHSGHPLARAIVEHAQKRGIAIRPAKDHQAIRGKGATGRFNGDRYWLGSHRFLEERGQETEEVHQMLEAMTKEGSTVVVVGNDTHVCGFISISDTIRPEAKQTIQDMRGAGVKHIVMLTGDNEGAAKAIAKGLGIDEVQAELLPADKIAAVDNLVARYNSVAMVGDGVNDAPAMARATLGIAMGAAGSDAAIETADIVLMSDDLSKLPWLIRHSSRTLSVIRQNIGFSLSVKVVFVVLTFLGHASLWAAIAADMGASLLVIFNGLRLLNGRSQ